jgi:hypothetical protein
LHSLEPYYRWRHLYDSAEDESSPFFQREYSEFEFTNRIYNYLIHPQWDEFGSETLLLKILYADYETGFAILEFIGEWNDCIENSIMHLKREVIDILGTAGINKYVLIGENILNFHPSDDSYYEEWYSDLEDGWIVALNFQEHVVEEFKNSRLDNYLFFGEKLNVLNWRKYQPQQLEQLLSGYLVKRLDWQ